MKLLYRVFSDSELLKVLTVFFMFILAAKSILSEKGCSGTDATMCSEKFHKIPEIKYKTLKNKILEKQQ